MRVNLSIPAHANPRACHELERVAERFGVWITDVRIHRDIDDQQFVSYTIYEGITMEKMLNVAFNLGRAVEQIMLKHSI